MKKYSIALMFILIAMLVSCEDVIDVEVPTASPRLVVEASINWEKGTTGNNQTIKLSTSTPYFDTTIENAVTSATVKVTNVSTNTEYVFTNQNNGIYSITNFVPVIDDIYALEVVYNGETYTATETLKSVPEINMVEQSLEGGFDDDVLDVTIFFDDPADEENYYLVRFLEEGDSRLILETLSDEFVNGNEIDIFFEKDRDEEDDQEEFNPGDNVMITLVGISERFYNYSDLLIEQYDSGGDPFSTTPAEIKGNCINETNTDNYAFGFFRLSEIQTINYTFE